MGLRNECPLAWSQHQSCVLKEEEIVRWREHHRYGGNLNKSKRHGAPYGVQGSGQWGRPTALLGAMKLTAEKVGRRGAKKED